MSNNTQKMNILPPYVWRRLRWVFVSFPLILLVIVIRLVPQQSSGQPATGQPSNGSGSGTGAAATAADITLGPDGTHQCTAAEVGKVVGCVATPTPPAPPADTDTDSDGILDAVDQCVDKPEDKDGVEDEDGCPENTADERLLLLEAQMKGQKGQWDAIGALKGRMTSVEARVKALEAWQQTVNGALRVGANSKRVVQTTDVFVVNGKQLDNLPPEVRKAIADAAGTK